MIKALVIDDYQEHVDTLVNTLSLYGVEARGASGGPEALDICESFQPHLIICDGLLEGMRAWQFAYELLYGDRQINRPYLVSLTGFASTQQRRLCEEHGYDEYVSKPIELSTLLKWVQQARTREETKEQRS